MNTSKVGLRFLSEERIAASPYARPLAVYPQYAQPTTGFTAPSSSYDKMRQIQASAEALNLQIQRYVADPIFRAGWNGWYEKGWLPFYAKYAGPTAATSTKLGALFHSDEIATQTESYRRQLENFYATYPQEKQTNGQPVPSPSSQPPPPGELLGSGYGLPWWFWVMGGIALVGTGYYLYQQAKGIQAKRAALEKHVLPKLIGPEMAAAAAARDF